MLKKEPGPRPVALSVMVILLLVMSGCLGSMVPDVRSPAESRDEGSRESSDSLRDPANPSGNGSREDSKGDANDNASAGDDPSQPPVPVTASHGSAVVHLDVNVTLDPPNEQGITDFTPEDGSVFIGFLRPETKYSIDVERLSFSFSTPESPWAWGAGGGMIHPGVRFSVPGATNALGQNVSVVCTMAFIMRDATNETLYGLTAHHCTDHAPNGEVFVDGEKVGDVVATGDDTVTSRDWALVEILDEFRNKTSPVVAHWSGPARPVRSVPVGDTVCIYGQSPAPYPVGSFHPLGNGHSRCDEILTQTEDTFRYSGKHTNSGDSGSPVIHHATGAALGVHTAGNPGYKGGPKICAILDQAAEKGFEVAVATAPYESVTPGVVPVGWGSGEGLQGCEE